MFSLVNLYIASYVVTIIKNIFFPSDYNIIIEEQNQHPKIVILFARCTQYYTLYAQLFLVYALLYKEYVFEAHVMQTAIFIVYHYCIAKNASLLTYEHKSIVNEITALLPPMNRNCLGWIILHIQHTLCPLHIWVLQLNVHERIEYKEPLKNLIYINLFYMWWNRVCWLIQRQPVYPFQKYIEDDLLIPFYCACFGLLITIATALNFIF